MTHILPPTKKEFKGYKICKICGDKHEGKGYCKKHLNKLRGWKRKRKKFIRCSNCKLWKRKHSKGICIHCYHKVHYKGYKYLFNKSDRRIFERAIDLMDQIGFVTYKNWGEYERNRKKFITNVLSKLEPFLVSIEVNQYYYDLDKLLWAVKKRVWRVRSVEKS